MHDQINSRANTILWVLFAASGLLFVIACSNVANLVLARTVRRETELAVRSALGASTAALRRSLLAESIVLCGSGALAALILAVPMVSVLGRYASRFSVRAEGLTLDFTPGLDRHRARAHRRDLPRLRSAPAFGRSRARHQPQRRRNSRHRIQQPPPAHLRHHPDHRVVPAPRRSRCALAHPHGARADPPAI